MLLDEFVSNPKLTLQQLVSVGLDKHSVLNRSASERMSLLTRLHQGSYALSKQVWSEGYSWPGLLTNSKELVSTCRYCIAYSVGKHGFHPLKSVIATYLMDQVSVDTIYYGLLFS